MALGTASGDVGASAPDGRHDVQLFGNLFERGDFREPVESVDYGLLVGHGKRLPLRGSEGKRRVATPNDPKLSDRGVRRGTCMAGGKAAAEARAVTATPVAELGVVRRCYAPLAFGTARR